MKLAMIAENDKRLYRAYSLKEHLRLLLKHKDTAEAEAELKRWLWRSSHSRISAFKELYKKIKRQYETTSTNECKNVDLPCKL